MTGKRFNIEIVGEKFVFIKEEGANYFLGIDEYVNARAICLLLNELNDENEQLKQQKPFLKIHNDYFIQYGDDRELFSMHKPSDIRSLIYLINRENGYDELECEYNEEGYGND